MHARKMVLDLPLKVVLTEEGTTFFIRKGKSLKRFKLADSRQWGFLEQSHSAA